MTYREMREILYTIITVLACIFVVMLVVGCAAVPLTHDQCNATKYATAMEHEQCLKAASEYEEKLHERQDRRIIRRDKLIARLNACDRHDDLVVLEIRHGRACLPNKREQQKAKREYGYAYTHGNVRKCANINNCRCVDARAVLESMGY